MESQWGQQRRDGWAGADIYPHVNADADEHWHGHEYPDVNADADEHWHTHEYPDIDADADKHWYGHADADKQRHADKHGDRLANQHCHGNADSHVYPLAYAHRYRYEHPNGNNDEQRHAYPHEQRRADKHGDRLAHADRYCQRDPYAASRSRDPARYWRHADGAGGRIGNVAHGAARPDGHGTGGLALLGQGVTVEARTLAGAPVTQFSQPLTLVIRYRDADVVGLDESRLQIFFWNEAQGTWVAIPTTVDPEANTLTIQLDHLTLFAALQTAPDGKKLYLPSINR